MPYEWSSPPRDAAANIELSLWPYRSLLRKDFVLFMGGTVALVALPLIALLGNVIMWVILPFFGAMIWGLWTALNVSYKRGEALEHLVMTADKIHLTHQTPKGEKLYWEANRYWATVHLHPKTTKIENYITLRGGDREVELGAFLDAEERLTLFDELEMALRH